MLDTAGAADFVATQLMQHQQAPCINSTDWLPASTLPAFCGEFFTPALCGVPRYSYVVDGSNIAQCQATGAHLVLNVLNPGQQACNASETPDAQYAADLTAWLQQQMGFVSGSKWKEAKALAVQSDATQQPAVSRGLGAV